MALEGLNGRPGGRPERARRVAVRQVAERGQALLDVEDRVALRALGERQLLQEPPYR